MEKSNGVVSFNSDLKVAVPEASFLRSGRYEPGQLKSLGTDAFVAFIPVVLNWTQNYV